MHFLVQRHLTLLTPSAALTSTLGQQTIPRVPPCRLPLRPLPLSLSNPPCVSSYVTHCDPCTFPYTFLRAFLVHSQCIPRAGPYIARPHQAHILFRNGNQSIFSYVLQHLLSVPPSVFLPLIPCLHCALPNIFMPLPIRILLLF